MAWQSPNIKNLLAQRFLGLPWRVWGQIVASLGLIALMISSREMLYPFLGDAKAFVYFLVPIMAAAYLFGISGGLTVALGAFFYTWIRFADDGTPRLLLDSQHSPGLATLHMVVAMCLVATMVGLRRTKEHRETALANELKTRRFLDSLIDNSPVGIALYDRDGKRVRANRRMIELTEYGEPPEDFPTFTTDLPDPDGLTGRAFEQVLRTRSAVREVDFSVGEPKSARYLRANFFPVFDEQTSLYGTAVLLIDLTQQRTADNQRAELLERERTARQEAEKSSRVKDEFVAMLSHELRTPLTAILGWADLLRTNVSDPQLAAAASEAIHQSCRAQVKMIEDLLDLSRLKTGRLRLELEVIDIGEIAAAASTTVFRQTDRRIVLRDSGEAYVLGDVHRLNQVFANLYENALKYTQPEGRITTEVSCDGGDVVVCVSDDGVGIEPEMIDVIFERFRQAETGATRRYGGLGLGLAVVKEIVELHGGTATASSAGGGKGSTFTIRLPATDAPPERRDPSEEVELHPLESLSQVLSSRKVLVVEDEATTRRVIRLMLEGLGAQVCEAESVAEGIAAFRTQRFDLIYSDIAMPEEDGYAFKRQLDALGNKAPVVALTAFGARQDREQTTQHGFCAHITKPFDLRTLAEVSRLVLKK